MRLHRNKKLYADDCFLIFALVAAAATAGVAWTVKDSVYLQIYVGLGWQKPAADFYAVMLEFEKRIQAASALIWLSLYSVKLSFMFFFKRLVRRVRHLEKLWWAVFSIVIVGGVVSMPLAFIICSNFTANYMSMSPAREAKILFLEC